MEGHRGGVPVWPHSCPGTQACEAFTVSNQFLCQGRENSDLYTSSHTSTGMWLMTLLPTCTGQIKPGGHMWHHGGGEHPFTLCLNLAKIFVKTTVTKFYEIKLSSVGWHHQFNWHEFEQALGDDEGQGSLVCCSPWGFKELDVTERLNNNSCSRQPAILICGSTMQCNLEVLISLYWPK